MNSEKREESKGPLLKEVFTVAIVSFIASLQLWTVAGFILLDRSSKIWKTRVRNHFSCSWLFSISPAATIARMRN